MLLVWVLLAELNGASGELQYLIRDPFPRLVVVGVRVDHLVPEGAQRHVWPLRNHKLDTRDQTQVHGII